MCLSFLAGSFEYKEAYILELIKKKFGSRKMLRDKPFHGHIKAISLECFLFL